MIRDTRVEMADYLPRYYGESKIVNGLLDVESVEFDMLQQSVQDVLNQFFISTATWGLDRWEKLAGIPTIRTNSYEQRRQVLQARLRGVGTVRVELIQNLAAAYSNGNVEVNEGGIHDKNKIPEFTSTDWIGTPKTITLTDETDDYRANFKVSAVGDTWYCDIAVQSSSTYCFSSLTYSGAEISSTQISKTGQRSATKTLTSGATVITAADTEKLRLRVTATSTSPIVVVHPQLELGTAATSFVPRVPPYTLYITFVGSMGVPSQLEALQSEIRKLIPAHLALKYKFKFYLYSQLQSTGLTYAQLAGKVVDYETLFNKGV